VVELLTLKKKILATSTFSAVDDLPAFDSPSPPKLASRVFTDPDFHAPFT
jgi:hypothetical protein